MDNLTHSLVGLTAAKAGLEKLSPGATMLCVLAANAPDSDIIVFAFGDRWTLLQHHRGITHSIVGVICLAVILPLIFYGVDQLWSRYKDQPPKTKLKGLLLASFIASATHPLLDWTNNYGIRFFLPWSQKWSYGDFVFIVDPYIWLMLGGAVFLLRVRGARERWGRKIAFVAIAFVLCYWSLLAFAHSRAVARGNEEAAKMASANGETVARLAAMPRLANPFRWDCVFETDRATYRFDLGLLSEGTANTVRYEKPGPELKEVVDYVSQQRPARIFLNFARFPVLKLADPGCTTRTLVQLADLRYPSSFLIEIDVPCPATRKNRARTD